ncbi:MAG: efflux RND transporter periplasmic adaptor subunit [Candidatus Desulfofervidaceae bacterium]|nr:efflux RND transporter periplasmic adaptor subunit [Candidatus Desulfofervidaceae bacterium]
MKKKLLVLLLLLGLTGGIYLWKTTTKNAPNELLLSGHIETTETDVAFKISGKISRLYVDEGDVVKKGQLLVELEAKDLKNKIALYEASLKKARANLAKLLAGYQPEEIEAAKAAMEGARVRLEKAQRDFERYQRLFKAHTISQERFDAVATAYKQAKWTYEETKARYQLLHKGYRKEDIASTRAAVAEAEAALNLARTNLSYTKLFAPVNGIVLVKMAEKGEYVVTGTPVFTLGDLDHVWLKAYVNETDLGRIKYGQKAVVTTDTYPDKRYNGKVIFIAARAEFTPKSVETHKERVTLVYKVKIAVENPAHELKPGMPAEAHLMIK